MTTDLITALGNYVAAAGAALNRTDPDKTREANERAGRAALEKARADLAASIPAVSEPAGPSRAEILRALRPATADALAFAARDREKVEALEKAGRSLDKIIAGASPERLGAILDNLEILPAVLASNDGEGVIAELEGLVFARLAEIGYEPAVERIRAEKEVAVPNAMSRVMTEALSGPVTLGASTVLYNADPETYRQVEALQTEGLAEAIVRSDSAQRIADLTAPPADAA